RRNRIQPADYAAQHTRLQSRPLRTHCTHGRRRSRRRNAKDATATRKPSVSSDRIELMNATKLLSLTSSKVLACISVIFRRSCFTLLVCCVLCASQASAQESQKNSLSDSARLFAAKALAHEAEIALHERNYTLGIVLLRSTIE